MNDHPVPDPSLVELALRVADHECENERPGSYWFGSREALRWVLGHRRLGPVSGAFEEIDLAGPQGRAAVRREAESAYAAMSGGGRTELSMPFLTGVENTCMWIVTGKGFAGVLDRSWLREHWGWE